MLNTRDHSSSVSLSRNLYDQTHLNSSLCHAHSGYERLFWWRCYTNGRTRGSSSRAKDQRDYDGHFERHSSTPTPFGRDQSDLRNRCGIAFPAARRKTTRCLCHRRRQYVSASQYFRITAAARVRIAAYDYRRHRTQGGYAAGDIVATYPGSYTHGRRSDACRNGRWAYGAT